jgi:hypothetical protein
MERRKEERKRNRDRGRHRDIEKPSIPESVIECMTLITMLERRGGKVMSLRSMLGN